YTVVKACAEFGRLSQAHSELSQSVRTGVVHLK
ncbi:hypothetical protein A2U01_0051152, partial [Trifolium medium]|nr:hypothetical protein [Trifolium medium]